MKDRTEVRVQALKDLAVALLFVLFVMFLMGMLAMLIVFVAEQFGWIEWGWVCDPNDISCAQGYKNPQ